MLYNLQLYGTVQKFHLFVTVHECISFIEVLLHVHDADTAVLCDQLVLIHIHYSCVSASTYISMSTV